ncbi:MAG TPA: 16S rRNA (cytosine(1402)-N(4))-methyltransferase RsmH [Acidimicrobiales bacterium]|nr:16S rRNA (cytosine(1402)-N(4))-methyltransferase RsmH [Acidimicrobiales bacterium]
MSGAAPQGPGARRAGEFSHRPVLVDLVVELFAPVPPGVVVDATLGGGGHAEALLDAHPHLSVVGLDQDPNAIAAASARLRRFGDRARTRHSRFDQLRAVLGDLGHRHTSGALFDLGVSSPQLDRPERGFSYRSPGPLDMRMDPTRPVSAADLVNGAPGAELARLLRAYGDERYAARIAGAIVAARPITSTEQLADVVRDAVPAPARRRGGHPARRTFQAIRIAVNDELAILPASLDDAIDMLVPGGRCVALAYHSGEDRIVKDRFRHAASGGWTGPSHLPTPPDVRPTVRLLRRGAWRPSADEIAANPRAEAARLRAVEKLQEVA